MTKLIIQLFAYSKHVRFLNYNKGLHLIKNGLCEFSNISVLVNCKSHMSLQIPLTCNLSKNIHKSSQGNSEHDGNIEETEVGFPLTKSIDLEEHSELFRNTLYPTSNDNIMVQLKSSYTIRHLLDVLNSNLPNLTSEHYCQFILVLWDLEYNYKIDRPNSGTFPFMHSGMAEHKLINDYVPVLLKALGSLCVNLEELSPEALVCSVLYSSRLGVNLKHPVIQSILMKVNCLLTAEDANSFSLSALSRLTIIFHDQDELWAKLFLIKTLPLIYKHFDRCSSPMNIVVDRCSSPMDFRALTISMLSTVSYLREDLLVEYEALTEELLRKGTLTRDQPSVILKAVLLLGNIYYKPTARYMVYKLLHMLSGCADKLFTPHLIDLRKIAWRHMEPHYTVKEVEGLKKSCTNLQSEFLYYPDFFPHSVQLVTVPSNSQGLLFLKEMISNSNNVESLLCVQPPLTTMHTDVCHIFWDKMAQLLTVDDTRALTLVCIRYIYFTARMVFYRHKAFESHMMSLITTELVEGTAVHKPSVFVLLATFVLSFDNHHHSKSSLSRDIVPRLLSMVGQFNTHSCLMLSRGLKQGMLFQRNKDLHLYLQLDSALNDRTRDILRTANVTSISTFNMILRSCINRKGSSESDLLWDVLKRSEDLDWSQLTSRSLRNLVYNFLITSALVPTAVDHMVEYCLDNRQYVMGDTLGKLAYLCYILGYMPKHGHSFCALAADLAFRDRDMMSGLSLLQVVLALSFFSQLPYSLSCIIFSVNFLERLDNEIKNCFAKDKYPLRVRYTLMQLNRSVCLDLPEADVPWFHSKFCEEHQALGKSEVRSKSLLFTDVLSTLAVLVGNPDHIRTSVYTPYGYNVDMQLNLDAALNPVPFDNVENTAHKLVLLLNYGDSYTVCERRLKGYHEMKQRHLEILGYKVICISDSLWNAMFMTEPKAKQKYLRNLIWPS